MKALRSPHNPIIEPNDLTPSRDDFEIIGVLNAGVTRFENEVVLLVRVAERPINENPDGTDNPEGRRLNRRVEYEITGLDERTVIIRRPVVPENLRTEE